jgi:hypothetical protein
MYGGLSASVTAATARSDAILSDYGHGDFNVPTFRTLVVGVRY